MFDFKAVELSDKAVLSPFLEENTYQNCDFSFSNIFCWQNKYHTSYALYEGCLFLRFTTSSQDNGYLMPLGRCPTKKVIERLIRHTQNIGEPLRLYAVYPSVFEKLDAAFPAQFMYCADPDLFDYIYKSEDLIFLKGKKLQPKRNHINKFRKTYDFEYLPITSNIIPQCIDLYDQWSATHEQIPGDKSLEEERVAMLRAFENFEALALKGGVIVVEGKIVAYSYGQQLTQDTFVVHAEKALVDIQGSYAIMNQQFAAHECSSYAYVNREEDLGLPSLRQAKLSYQPSILLEKGQAAYMIKI